LSRCFQSTPESEPESSKIVDFKSLPEQILDRDIFFRPNNQVDHASVSTPLIPHSTRQTNNVSARQSSVGVSEGEMHVLQEQLANLTSVLSNIAPALQNFSRINAATNMGNGGGNLANNNGSSSVLHNTSHASNNHNSERNLNVGIETINSRNNNESGNNNNIPLRSHYGSIPNNQRGGQGQNFGPHMNEIYNSTPAVSNFDTRINLPVALNADTQKVLSLLPVYDDSFEAIHPSYFIQLLDTHVNCPGFTEVQKSDIMFRLSGRQYRWASAFFGEWHIYAQFRRDFLNEFWSLDRQNKILNDFISVIR
jgi:hypothetical protein